MTDSPITLSGVPIHIKIWGDIKTPAAVINSPATMPKATVVCTAR